MAELITSPKLAELLGITRQHVHTLANDGVLSFEKNEKGWLLFDPEIATQEFERYEASKKGAPRIDDDLPFDDEDGVTSLKYQRALHEMRIKRATADIKELERDEMLGIYHRAEFVEDWVTELILAQRSAMAALPGKLAPILAGETDEAVIAARIKDEVRAIQEDLAQYEYNPGYYRERLAEIQGKTITDEDE